MTRVILLFSYSLARTIIFAHLAQRFITQLIEYITYYCGEFVSFAFGQCPLHLSCRQSHGNNKNFMRFKEFKLVKLSYALKNISSDSICTCDAQCRGDDYMHRLKSFRLFLQIILVEDKNEKERKKALKIVSFRQSMWSASW